MRELQSYDFTLPNNLLAFSPSFPRDVCKLLVYKKDTKKIIHTSFNELFSFIPNDYLILLNDTKVLKARIFAHKEFKNKSYEILFHKALSKTSFLVQIKGKIRPKDILELDCNTFIRVNNILKDGFKDISFLEKLGEDFILLEEQGVLNLLQEKGKIPLPPYIKRDATLKDEIDYQSVFAKNLGSIAAPTASLHFSKQMLKSLKDSFNHAFLTLHVGAGTFKPVVAEDILEHKIHSEFFSISKSSAEKINKSSKILCIGTTSLRVLEFYNNTKILQGECDIFLHPFNRPKKADALLTNFHMPKSSLLMLVAGFLSLAEVQEIYKEAIAKEYKFYSYGDCMLII